MSIAAALAIYFIIWWLVLFAVLPFGVKSQVETGRVVPGSDPGAPHSTVMRDKVIATTLVAAVVFGLYYANYTWGFITLDDIPFMPRAVVG
jgi:predicted secreted protein